MHTSDLQHRLIERVKQLDDPALLQALLVLIDRHLNPAPTLADDTQPLAEGAAEEAKEQAIEEWLKNL
jgi:hypothetical protein